MTSFSCILQPKDRESKAVCVFVVCL